MEPNNKHNIFSKEEFFKRIDEKRSLSPEADDFDKEAMEGLEMVTDRKKLDTLDDAIDEVLRREASKAKRKRNIYYFSAAASLLLVVGLFFLLKENTFAKKDTGLAVNTEQREDKAPLVSTEQKPASDAGVPDEKASENTAALGADKKEEKAREGKLEMQLRDRAASGETFAADITTVNEPLAEQANKQEEVSTKTPAFKSMNGDVKANTSLDDVELSQGGKSDANSGNENQKNLPGKKADEKKIYKEESKENEKDKYRYETNTVWTTPPKEDKKVADELKKKSAEEDSKKPEVASDNRNVVSATGGVTTSGNNAAPAPVQQDQQVAVNGKDEDRSKSQDVSGNVTVTEEKASQGPARSQHSKKRKLKKANQPATGAARDNEKAGYYSQTATRGLTSPVFTGGDAALQKFVKENLTISSPDKSGTVVAQFTIKADGSIDAGSVKVLTPIQGCEACSKDVIELIKKMPKWQPASDNGKSQTYLQKLSVPYNTAGSAK